MNDANLSVIDGAGFEPLDNFRDSYVNDFPEYGAEFIDDDGLLYTEDGEVPDDDNDGWKSVDINADCAPTDETIQDNSGSGGGVPPPPGTTSFSDEEEPGHQRRPSTALITLKLEHEEHEERAETFSTTDFEDPDWISPIYPESMWRTLFGLGEAYCDECTKTSVKVTALNAAYFARAMILNSNLHMHHGEWYIYFDNAGSWRVLRKPELLNVIHRCVIAWGENHFIFEIVKLCSRRFCADVISFMMPFPEYENIFDHAPKYVTNVRNSTLIIDSGGNIVQHDHSPEFLCRKTINIDYDPSVDYTDFVKEMFGDHVSPEDLEIMQMYAGQCLLGWNVSQTILLISGKAGTGKSNIVGVIERVLGPGSYEGLRTNMLDRPFETSRFDGKSLLVASDQFSDALMKKGAHMLKTLTGGDEDTTERKGENEHSMIKGEFNVIMVSNSELALSIDGDSAAWSRRLRPVKYVGERPKVLDRRFVDHMLAKYSKQILKWMVDGAAALRRNGDEIKPHPKMVERIDALIQDSDACLAFVKNHVVHTGNTKDVLFSYALYNGFTASDYFVGSGSKQIIQTKLKKAMKDVYGAERPQHHLIGPDGKAKYGYVGYRLEWSDLEAGETLAYQT